MNKDKHIPQGYKDSPLGIIPKEWEVKRLGDVCKISVGRDVQIDHFKETKTDKFRYPVYSNTVEEKGLYGYYDYEEYCSGAVTVVGRGVGLGTSFARDRGFGAIGRLVVLHPHNCLRNHFLENYINNEVKFFVESAAIPQLTGEQIATYKILIPPLSQQEKMENYINLWDTAIEKQSELIEKLTLRKRALMQQLLTGKKRLPGFSEDWKRIKAGEIYESSSIRGNANEVLLSATQENGVIPRNQLEGRVTMPTGELYSFKLVEEGDFVISLRSFQGGIEYSKYRGIVSPAYTVLKPVKEIDKSFYRFYFKSSDFIGHLAIAVIGIRDGKQISYEDFCFVKIPYPSIEEQKAISAILLQSEKEIELANEKLANLQSQKRGLMQQLLTGKKRVIE